MKVLIVNTQDIEGGAARAAYRLHQALLVRGVDSKMLVQAKTSDDYTVIRPESVFQKVFNKIRPFLDTLPARRYKNRQSMLFSPAWVPFSSVVNEINDFAPDVVHLHWVAGGILRIEDLTKIKAPIVWSLHDDWVFTGGCHIKWQCEHYKNNCGLCPRLGSKQENDLSRSVFERKKKTFDKLTDMTIIGVSKWLSECATQSALLKNHHILNLPNLLNTQTYAPFDKKRARELLNLPQEKRLVLFGAMSAVSDRNKGFNELSKALLKVDADDTELVVFGSSKPEQEPAFKQRAHYVGRLHDDVSLRVLYCAADIMVVPSLQEAFGQTAMEAMACGTPVVAFATSGLLDIVDHRVNGYLAKPFDIDDLAYGMEWLMKAPNYNEISSNSRQKIIDKFDSKTVVESYLKLYQEVAKSHECR